MAQPNAAGAAPGQFGRTLVRGVAIEAPPRMLYSNGDILSHEAICGGINDSQQIMTDAVNYLVGEINTKLKQRVEGVQLVRVVFTPSPQCQARTEMIGANEGLMVRVFMPGNRFKTNVTNSLVGQWADPEMSFTFDAEVNVVVPLPAVGGQCLGAPKAAAQIRNIALPKGHNIPGKIVAAGIDVGAGIYDYFNNGRLGRVLAQGERWHKAVPASFITNANRALCGSGVPYRTLSMSTAPGDLLMMRLSTGAKIEDARCQTGFVWRQARKDDLVCVKPEIRAQTREENRLHRDRVVPLSEREMMLRSVCIEPGACPAGPPQACLSGFVWREAYPKDLTCVPPASRAQAQTDNREAKRRRLDYEGPPVN